MQNKDFIFGLHAIIEAIQAGKEIEKVLLKKELQGELFKDLFALIRQREVPFQFVPQEKLNRITQKNHQGAVAFISGIEYQNIEEIIASLYEQGKEPFILILDEITDVRNFGAIARTAECAGVNAIVVPIKNSALINGDAVKTSAGALHTIPVCRVNNLKDTVKYLKESGLRVIVATEKAADTIYQQNYLGPLAIVMGAEDRGISPDILKIADNLAKIPMKGIIASLNVSVASGVIIYEALRQREINNG